MSTFIARRAISAAIMFSMLASALVMFPGEAYAAAWTDHFDGTSFDARWESFGDGVPMLDNSTHWWALYHDPENQTIGDWRGPGVRATFEDSYAFEVTAVVKCVANDYNMGRNAIRLTGAGGIVVYEFGWEDPSSVNNNAEFYVRGAGNASVYSTGLSYANSVFIDKPLRLVRESSVITFYVDGVEKYSGAASTGQVSALELQIMKSDDACPLDPTSQMFDSVSVDFTPAKPPAAPSNLSAVPSNGSIALTWSAADAGTGPAVAGYKVFRGLSAGAELYLTTVGPVTDYADVGLFNGLRYFYKVSAVSPTGESALSNEASATPRTVPGAPQNLQAVSSGGAVQLTWSPPAYDGGADISGYIVYKGGAILAEAATLGAVTIWSDAAVTDGITYRYAVSAVNEAGEGVACDIAEVMVGAAATAPSEPRSLMADAGDSHVVLSWNAPLSNGNSAITKYSVRRGTAPAGESWLADVVAGTSYNDTGVSNGQTYYYTVTATNSVGESPKSDEVSATPFQPGAATVPGAPQNLIAEAGTGHVLVSWYAPASDGGSAVTQYAVWRGIGDGNLTRLATVGPVFAYADTSVNPGTEYLYTVSAVNGVGEGPVAAGANVTTPGQNATDNATDTETDWLKDWTWMHSAGMLVLMGVCVAGIIYWMSHPEQDSGKTDAIEQKDKAKDSAVNPSPEGPDKGVDGKPDEDATNKEAGE